MAEMQSAEPSSAVQLKEMGFTGGEPAGETAESGIAGTRSQLPHLDAIQRSFGGHDLSHVQAHTDAAAGDAAAALGASAYTTGDHVAFRGTPDLHTAAHEAAHVIQQRAGVELPGGVGQAGDAYERNADAVADRVIRGASAADLLPDSGECGGAARACTQARIQKKPGEEGAIAEPDRAVHDHAGRLRQLADPLDPSNPNNKLSPQDMYATWLKLWTSRDDTARPRREQLEDRIRAKNPADYADKMDMFRGGRRDALGPEYEAAANEADLCTAQLSVMNEVLEWLEAQKATGRSVTLDHTNQRALETARAKSIYTNTFMTVLLVGYPIALAGTGSLPAKAGHLPEGGTAERGATGVESPSAPTGTARSVAERVPQISAGTSREMLGQALSHLKSMEGSALEKAAAFEEMAAQISSLSGGSWNAVRTVAADGAHIFTGELGHAVVISPTGQVFLGNVLPSAGNFSFGSGGLLQPRYDALRPVQ